MEHAVSIEQPAVGPNFVVRCTCGYVNNVASQRRSTAAECAARHLEVHLVPSDREVIEMVTRR